MYYVYLIVNEFGERYIGYTSNLKRRLSEHNSGSNASTRNHKWRLVYYEAYLSKEDASRREKKLKQRGRSKDLLYERVRDSLEEI